MKMPAIFLAAMVMGQCHQGENCNTADCQRFNSEELGESLLTVLTPGPVYYVKTASETHTIQLSSVSGPINILVPTAQCSQPSLTLGASWVNVSANAQSAAPPGPLSCGDTDYVLFALDPLLSQAGTAAGRTRPFLDNLTRLDLSLECNGAQKASITFDREDSPPDQNRAYLLAHASGVPEIAYPMNPMAKTTPFQDTGGFLADDLSPVVLGYSSLLAVRHMTQASPASTFTMSDVQIPGRDPHRECAFIYQTQTGVAERFVSSLPNSYVTGVLLICRDPMTSGEYLYQAISVGNAGTCGSGGSSSGTGSGSGSGSGSSGSGSGSTSGSGSGSGSSTGSTSGSTGTGSGSGTGSSSSSTTTTGSSGGSTTPDDPYLKCKTMFNDHYLAKNIQGLSNLDKTPAISLHADLNHWETLPSGVRLNTWTGNSVLEVPGGLPVSLIAINHPSFTNTVSGLGLTPTGHNGLFVNVRSLVPYRNGTTVDYKTICIFDPETLTVEAHYTDSNGDPTTTGAYYQSQPGVSNILERKAGPTPAFWLSIRGTHGTVAKEVYSVPGGDAAAIATKENPFVLTQVVPVNGPITTYEYEESPHFNSFRLFRKTVQVTDISDIVATTHYGIFGGRMDWIDFLDARIGLNRVTGWAGFRNAVVFSLPKANPKSTSTSTCNPGITFTLGDNGDSCTVLAWRTSSGTQGNLSDVYGYYKISDTQKLARYELEYSSSTSTALKRIKLWEEALNGPVGVDISYNKLSQAEPPGTPYSGFHTGIWQTILAPFAKPGAEQPYTIITQGNGVPIKFNDKLTPNASAYTVPGVGEKTANSWVLADGTLVFDSLQADADRDDVYGQKLLLGSWSNTDGTKTFAEYNSSGNVTRLRKQFGSAEQIIRNLNYSVAGLLTNETLPLTNQSITYSYAGDVLVGALNSSGPTSQGVSCSLTTNYYTSCSETRQGVEVSRTFFDHFGRVLQVQDMLNGGLVAEEVIYHPQSGQVSQVTTAVHGQQRFLTTTLYFGSGSALTRQHFVKYSETVVMLAGSQTLPLSTWNTLDMLDAYVPNWSFVETATKYDEFGAASTLASRTDRTKTAVAEGVMLGTRVTVTGPSGNLLSPQDTQQVLTPAGFIRSQQTVYGGDQGNQVWTHDVVPPPALPPTGKD